MPMTNNKDHEGEGLLLPCPFCGADAFRDDEEGVCRVGCSQSSWDCAACPVVASHGSADAVTWWNTRTQPPASEGLVTDATYHCEQAATYIAQPPDKTTAKHMASARWHLAKAIAALQAQPAADVRHD